MNSQTSTTPVSSPKHYLPISIMGAIQPYKLNHILSPMGSGKTTLIKQLLDKQHTTPTLILSPFIVSNAEFDAYKDQPNIEMAYYTNLVKKLVKGFNEECPSQYANSGKYLQAWYSYLVNKFDGYNIFMDETDFIWLQCTMSKTLGSFTNNDNDTVSLDAEQAMSTLLVALAATSPQCVSVSANYLGLPDSFLSLCTPNFDPINTINSNLQPNTNIKTIGVWDTSGIRADNITRDIKLMLKQLVKVTGKDAKTLVYTSKFTKGTANIILEDVPRAALIARQANLALVEDDNGLSLPIGAGMDNMIAVGHKDKEDILRDELFKHYDTLAVNMSSTRSVSLTDAYSNAWIIVIQRGKPNAASLQVLGRYRNAPVNVLWVGDVSSVQLQYYANAIDPFFNQYAPNVVNVSSLRSDFGITDQSKVNPVRVSPKTITKQKELHDWLCNNVLVSSRKDHAEYKVIHAKGYGLGAFTTRRRAYLHDGGVLGSPST